VYGQRVGGIVRVSADGGMPESIVKSKSDSWIGYPQILPGGKLALYRSLALSNQSKIMVQSLKSGESKELFSGFFAQYLPTGHIVYMTSINQNISLFAIPFNLDRLEATGGAVPVLEGFVRFAISQSGILVYVPRARSGFAPQQGTLVWVNSQGKEEPLAAASNAYAGARISPDGTKVALTIGSSAPNAPAALATDIWIWDIGRETPTRLTSNGAWDPLWTLDSKRIVFRFRSQEKPGVYCKARDGTGKEVRLDPEQNQIDLVPSSWSADGKTLLLTGRKGPTGPMRGPAGGPTSQVGYRRGPTTLLGAIYALSMEGDHNLKALIKEENYGVSAPEISPDGRWMAYVSNESGTLEVYVRPFPEVEKWKEKVSTNGGDLPLWSPDGRELFYRNGDSVMAVAVQTQPTFKLAKAVRLFQNKNLQGGWDIHPDNKRFLMVKPAAATAQPTTSRTPDKINIVLNWFEELKQKAPRK
jgi:Tol biopolymer transport system component